jgi:dTMP kinase
VSEAPATRGLFVVLEGGDGVGKSTQADLLVAWLRSTGRDVVRTHEPGASAIGPEVRALLLERDSPLSSPWAEALLYAADRAEHVAGVVRPALARGAVVVCDRYVDSSVAYQGVSRGLGSQQVAQVSSWATGGLRPDLTVLLDLDPAVALTRSPLPADRLESLPLAFHTQVRQAFLDRAAADPEQYLVLDAADDPATVQRQIRARLEPLLAAVPAVAT